jgi:hypothetical protein
MIAFTRKVRIIEVVSGTLKQTEAWQLNKMAAFERAAQMETGTAVSQPSPQN